MSNVISKFCKKCPMDGKCEYECKALKSMFEYMKINDFERKVKYIKDFKDECKLIYTEPDKELEALANKIIDAKHDLKHIRHYDIKIGYVKAYKDKTKSEKTVFGECIKINDIQKAYLPFDFVIVIYSSGFTLSDNKLKLLMYHELKHIGIGERGPKLEPHNVEDFADIILEFGLDWCNPYNGDIDDILGGDQHES